MMSLWDEWVPFTQLIYSFDQDSNAIMESNVFLKIDEMRDWG